MSNETFYDEKPEKCLRFGDVICGFQVPVPRTHDPKRDMRGDLSIVVHQYDYLAVLTPCCSIEDKAIALAPLIHIRLAFLRNPHYVVDMTRINRKLKPENSVPPDAWTKMPMEKKEQLLAEGEAFAHIECFVYDAHPLLRKYKLDMKVANKPGESREVGHYLVDFKRIFRVECDRIQRDAEAPQDLKILQLTPLARRDLRDKLAFYFGRVPDEDRDALVIT